MKTVQNLIAYKLKVSNLNATLFQQFVTALEKHLSFPDFVGLFTNQLISDSYFTNNETQIVLVFTDDSTGEVTRFAIEI